MEPSRSRQSLGRKLLKKENEPVLERNEALEESNLPAPGSPAPALDPIRVAWRWKWLILLGAGIGTGLGYLNWTKEPTVYTASARLQVTMPLPIGVDD
jgi:hypothetical protein